MGSTKTRPGNPPAHHPPRHPAADGSQRQPQRRRRSPFKNPGPNLDFAPCSVGKRLELYLFTRNQARDPAWFFRHRPFGQPFWPLGLPRANLQAESMESPPVRGPKSSAAPQRPPRGAKAQKSRSPRNGFWFLSVSSTQKKRSTKWVWFKIKTSGYGPPPFLDPHPTQIKTRPNPRNGKPCRSSGPRSFGLAQKNPSSCTE